MPEKKHLKGVSDKEQRQYEHIKESAEREGPLRQARERSCGAHGHEGTQRERSPERGTNSSALTQNYEIGGSLWPNTTTLEQNNQRVQNRISATR
jgi:hypothetical protein